MSEPSRIVSTEPKPLPKDTKCPRCHAAASKRVLSAGFGNPHDVCGNCGHDFEERTL
jgi:transcription elongation factor Elf1